MLGFKTALYKRKFWLRQCQKFSFQATTVCIKGMRSCFPASEVAEVKAFHWETIRQLVISLTNDWSDKVDVNLCPKSELESELESKSSSSMKSSGLAAQMIVTIFFISIFLL